MPYFRYEFKNAQTGETERYEVEAASQEDADATVQAALFPQQREQVGRMPDEAPPLEQPEEDTRPSGQKAVQAAMTGGSYGFPGMFAMPEPDIAEGLVAGGAKRMILGPGQAATMLYAYPGSAIEGKSPDEIMARYQEGGESFLEMIRGPASEQSEESRIAENIGDWGTLMTVGLMTSPGTTLPRLFAAGATEGALGAASTYDSMSDLAALTRSTAYGTLAGLGGVAAFNLGKYGLQRIGAKIIDKMKGPPNEAHAAALAELDKLLPGLDPKDKDELFNILLTEGQKSGSKALLAFESRLAGEYGFSHYRKLAKHIEENLLAFGKRWGNRFDTQELAVHVARQGQEATRAAARDLRNLRKLEFNDILEVAEEVVKRGDDIGTPGSGIVGKQQYLISLKSDIGEANENLRDFIINIGRRFNLADTEEGILAEMSEPVRNLVREFEAFGGQGVSLDRMIQSLKKFNGNNWQISNKIADPDVNKALGADLRNALFRSIDDADATTSQAMRLVKGARESYTTRSLDVDIFENSSFAKALGIDGPAPDQIAAVKALTEMEPEAAARMVSQLTKVAPDLVNDMRAYQWNSMMENAKLATADPVYGEFDPVKFAETILKNLGGEAPSGTQLRLAGVELPSNPAARQSLEASIRGFRSLYSEPDRVAMRQALKQIRFIMAHVPKGKNTFDPEGAFMTGAGALSAGAKGLIRATPFLARQYYRLTFGENLDKILFTPEGRALLNQAYKNVGSPKFNVSLGALVGHANKWEPQGE